MVPNETCLIGLIATCLTACDKYVSRLKCWRLPLKYLLNYKLSQDHLELFFAATKANGGCRNNNPNATQFKAAYKHVLQQC